ncbi:MAG: transcriptional regulator [Dorea sp.]|nr:transcriptional regulator [Dorea sp.]
MVFDYKKEYKEFYIPPKKPGLIEIPEINYIAVRGKGNPNEPEGEYKTAIQLLYGIAYTIKMSNKSGKEIEGYFPYVVPPLEGLWWQQGIEGIDYAHKERFEWISMIRLPEFVTKEVFDWAVIEASEKKKSDFSKAEFYAYREGLCVQCMHIGSYDAEPETVAQMNAYMKEQGYEQDFSETRFHHEIYLSDPRRTKEERLRTVIRHPVKPV